LVRHPTVLDVQDVEPAPATGATLRLERAHPADERFARLGVDEEVFAFEAHLAEVAPELRYEGRADGGVPAVDRPGELLVDCVLGQERHDALEVVLVKRLGEADHQVFESRSIHAGSYTIGP